jgi:hypothetical protein
VHTSQRWCWLHYRMVPDVLGHDFLQDEIAEAYGLGSEV